MTPLSTHVKLSMLFADHSSSLDTIAAKKKEVYHIQSHIAAPSVKLETTQ